MSKMSVIAEIEAILFSSPQPMSVKALAKALSKSPEDVEKALTNLEQRYGSSDSGLQLLRHDGRVQLVTAAACEPVVASLQKDELEGELTKPSLETLTVIAYRGPITRQSWSKSAALTAV